jgi:hypothetical protein
LFFLHFFLKQFKSNYLASSVGLELIDPAAAASAAVCLSVKDVSHL